MIYKLIDKIIFGAFLLLSLQVPQLTDHYHQYLTGLYQATKWQVEGYESTAKKHEFSDARSMITRHLSNSEPSVRTDAEQKLITIDTYEDLEKGINVFETGTLLHQILYMINPNRYHVLKDVITNFTVGIPLSVTGLTFGVVMGLFLNIVISAPLAWYFRRKKS